VITRDRRRGSTPPPDKRRWWLADEGAVHKAVFGYVENIERQQFDLFNRFVQLEELYDPHAPNSPGALSTDDAIGLVIENVIASNVDTVTAQIAANEIRARFMTDDGDWSVQRMATRLEWYAEGLGKLLDIPQKAELAFKEAAKKGTGALKIYTDQFDEIRVEHVRIDDLIVDEAECRNGGTPRQIHQRMTNVDREELKARFPDHAEEIDRAQTGPSWAGRSWAGYRPMLEGSLIALESWRLPIGRRGRVGYVPGRHAIAIEGCDLVDEPWHKPFFPFSSIVWSERTTSWYGISLAERIAGIQRALNKRNWQIDMNLDHNAVPVTYVDMADANLAVQSINRVGTIVVAKGARPTTVINQSNSPEVYQHREAMKAAASEDSGVSRFASQAVKPAGIDSGVGMREYRDQTTQRFAPQEKRFERLVLDTCWHVLDCCKDLGADAPVVTRKAKFGARTIKWADVDMGDVKVQIAAASTLPRTPAGRYQTALEWAQAGVITTDEWRRLTKHPDLDHILSLYTQGWESVERDIEAIEDGHVVVPEPFGNLQLMVRMGQMAYLKDRDLNAPEEVLEALRDYAVLAAHMLNSTTAANQNAAPGSAPPVGAGGPPQPPGMAGPPVAALSPQAMDLKAG
jgi:hypothetical protein